MDRLLFRAINGWPDALNPVLTPLSVAYTWPAFRILMVAMVIGMAVRGRGRTALLALIAFPVADGIAGLVRRLSPHPRPLQDMPDIVLRVASSPSPGTASSHAANMAAIATVMTLGLGWKWGLPWIVVALLVGISRIYVGAHYPSQVLFGWVIGAATGFIVNRAAHMIGTKRAERRQPPPTDDRP